MNFASGIEKSSEGTSYQLIMPPCQIHILLTCEFSELKISNVKPFAVIVGSTAGWSVQGSDCLLSDDLVISALS